MPVPHDVNETLSQFQDLLGLYWPRFAASIVGGGLIGVENQVFGKPAGLRTSLLVTLSCCVITIVSIQTAILFGGEPSRITAQIITGIGFLGGGVILRNRGKVSGITTAATIFVDAGIGITAGSGLIYTAIATGLLAFLILLALRPLDRFLDTYPPLVRIREKDERHDMARNRRNRVVRISNNPKSRSEDEKT